MDERVPRTTATENDGGISLIDDAAVAELHDYARAVARALGVVGDSWCVQAEPHAEIYLALDIRLERFPEQDVALLWQERRGWSVVVETSGEDALVVVETRRGGVRPAACQVVRWAEEVFGRWSTAAPVPPRPRRADRTGLPARPQVFTGS